MKYNIRRHYVCTQASKHDEYSGKLREGKVKRLGELLTKQQSVFKRVHQASESLVWASYRIAHKIAMFSEPFSERNFIRISVLLATEDICPEKRQVFANIIIPKNIVSDRFNELSENLNKQLKEKVVKFVAFSVAIDENTDVTDTAQVVVFIHGVNGNMEVTEEFVELAVNFIRTRGLKHRQFNSLLEETHGRTLPYHTDKFGGQAAGNNAHFPGPKSLQDAPEFHGNINIKKYCNKISTLVGKFGERANEAPEQFQLELIELQCNSVLKDKISTSDVGTFYQYAGPIYPQIKCLALRMMSMFGSIYVCEQLFSVMNLNKSRKLLMNISTQH
ncbi:general transcription factor II-I repeat domain-containing protein 2-like [Oratosquilla oratoria]|uniref:general transcription factor II-I repeat domain-containing protein 2-like n=1 Tax=Oratosquilla oratoria TaxID=337810 RepID=UPI003F775C25